MKTKFNLSNRMLSLLLALVLVLGMMPTTALAATGPFTSFTVGGTEVTGTQSGSNWSYDASSKTLTITGNIGASTGSLAINAPTAPNCSDVLTVRVTKNATVKGGIYAGCKLNLVVDSGVTLKVDASGMYNAIHADYTGGVKDTLQISGGGTVYAVAKGYGIYGRSGIQIEGVTVAAKGSVYGLYSGETGSIYIENNSKVYAEASSNGELHAAIRSGTGNAAKLKISGSNTVVIAGFALGSEANGYVPDIYATPVAARGIFTGNTDINCGHLVLGGTFQPSDAAGYGGMTSIDSTDQRYQFVSHLNRYESNDDGATHSRSCVQGCPIPIDGITENCSGGAANCTHKAACSKCGQGYGSINPDNHSPKTAATCQSVAVCQWCDKSYGDVDKNNHVGTVIGWEYSDMYKHYIVYSCCGTASGEKGNHTPAEEDAHTCGKCGVTLSSCRDRDNDHVCEICGKVSACADENYDHLCDLCNKTLTECIDADNDQACDICGKMSGSADYVEYSWDGTKLVSQNKNAETVTAILGTSQSLSAGWYVVRGDVTVAERLKISGTVSIILADGATLNAQQGIDVPGGSTLNIYAQTGGTGNLTAQNGGLLATAIGSTNRKNTGTINIHGGHITAAIDSGQHASAIGSGGFSAGGAITIYGGNITATGDKYGAGIGGGDYAESVDITIYGGTIHATGGFDGAGIGSGNHAKSGDITIYGGNITAIGGKKASGIGGGYGAAAGNITIHGGTVTATGGSSGAGIGSGEKNDRNDFTDTGTVTIHGGTVTATGGTNGAGIGGGSCAAAGNITIYGGMIHATGGSNGAGIGSGYKEGDYYTDTGAVTIHGGTVTATGGSNGAGIGGGRKADGAVVVITGGNVKAVAGTNAEAIGKGRNGAASGTLQDASGNDLRLVTITLGDATEQVAVTQVDGIGSYGLKDVKTLDINKLYFYLPATGNPTAVTADGKRYEGTEENGAGAFYSHIHSWTYTVSGETITATCGNTDGFCTNTSGGSATLKATDTNYTGFPITTGASVTFSDDWIGSKEYGEITYSNNLTAGNATAKVTVEGKELTTTFKINPVTITDTMVNLSPTSGTYSGNAFTPNISVTFGGAALVENTDYTFSWDKTGFTTSDTYTVRVVGIGNFTGFVDKTFTINAASLSDIKVEQVGTLTYNSEAQTPVVSANATAVNDQPITFTYSKEQNGTYGDLPSFTNAGTYTVYYKATAPNHNEATGSFEVKIGRAALNATVEQIGTLTYNGTAQTPTIKTDSDAVASAGYGFEYSTTIDGSYTTQLPSFTEVGTYTVYFNAISQNGNYDDDSGSFVVTVKKAAYDMSGARWDYTAAFDYDGYGKTVTVIGLPSGVTVSGYEGNEATAVGNYTAKVTFSYDSASYEAPVLADLNWSIKNDWTPTEYVVSTPNDNGWLNDAFTIIPAEGYWVSLTNTADSLWDNKLTYSDETANGSVTFYLKNADNGKISLEKTVTYKIDKTAPTGKVEFVDRTGWEKFVNSITFGLFYKDEVTVKITTNDDLSGVANVEYYAADKAMTLEEVKAITDWTAYNGSFGVSVEDTKQFVYFVRITDNAGNVTYLSTNGAEYDTTAPVISGIENGKTYYTTQKVTVTEKNVASITLNGETAGNEIVLEGNKNATYTIVVTDKAGNSTTVTVTMKPISDLSAPIDTLNKDNVNSGNEQVVNEVKAAVAAVGTTNATEQEKAALKEIADKAAELEKVIDDAKAALAELNKPADPNSPQTGDNSHMMLWIALLFISGGAVITLTVVDRKRRTTSKR